MHRICANPLDFPDPRHLRAPLASLGERVPDLGDPFYRRTRRAEACATLGDTSHLNPELKTGYVVIVVPSG
jgi:hypothetical protein